MTKQMSKMTIEELIAEAAILFDNDEKSQGNTETTETDWDTDSGLGIGGIGNDQSMPHIPSEKSIAKVQEMHDTDTICRRCHASQNFDGAMFTTLGGTNICDDCV
jgi:hypothetical protein